MPSECNPVAKFAILDVLLYELQRGGGYHFLRIDIRP